MGKLAKLTLMVVLLFVGLVGYAQEVDIDALVAEAEEAWLNDDDSTTVALYKILVEAEPDNALYRFRYGYGLEAADRNFEASNEQYLAALTLDTSEIPVEVVQNNIGNNFNLMGEPEQALSYFNESIAINNEYTLAYRNRALTQINLGNFDAAYVDIENLRAIDPEAGHYLNTVLDVLWLHGNALFEMGDFEQALDRFTTLEEFIGTLDGVPVVSIANVYRELGRTHNAMGDSDTAILYFDEAIRLNQGDVSARRNRAITQVNLGNFQAAYDDVSAMQGIAPQSSDYLNTVLDVLWLHGNAFADAGQFDEALVRFEQLEEFIGTLDGVPPTSIANLYLEMGYAHGALGDVEQAGAYFARTEELAPDAWAVHQAKGYLAADTGDFEGAVAHLSRAIELNSERMALLFARGKNYENLGQFDLALADLDQVVATLPEDPHAVAGRAITHAYAGDSASADADLVTAVELGLSEDDPTEFALVAGVVAERSGDLAEAGGYYRTFLEAVESERVAAGELALNAPTIVEMTAGRVVQVTVNLEGNQPYTVGMLPSPDNPYRFDSLFVVLDPSGNPVLGVESNAADGDWSTIAATFTPTESGVYTVWFGHSGGVSEGVVTISVTNAA